MSRPCACWGFLAQNLVIGSNEVYNYLKIGKELGCGMCFKVWVGLWGVNWSVHSAAYTCAGWARATLMVKICLRKQRRGRVWFYLNDKRLAQT